MMKMTAHAARATMPRYFPSWASFSCDLAHLRLHARSRDDRRRRAVGDGTARKDHVVPVADGGVLRDFGKGVLFRRHALARQRGLLRLQVGTPEKAGVGGDEVARFEDDDVARDELGRLHELLLAVTDDARVRRGHIFERFERLFRLALLHQPHDGVEDDDEDDERGLDKLDGILLPLDHLIADDAEGDARRDQEDDDHHVLELFKKADDEGLFLPFVQFVLAVLRPACGDLFCRKPVLRVRFQFGEHFACGPVVISQSPFLRKMNYYLVCAAARGISPLPRRRRRGKKAEKVKKRSAELLPRTVSGGAKTARKSCLERETRLEPATFTLAR